LIGVVFTSFVHAINKQSQIRFTCTSITEHTQTHTHTHTKTWYSI